MTQSDLDRAVAHRTGESPRLIRKMGFVLLIPNPSRRSRGRRNKDDARQAALSADTTSTPIDSRE